MDESIFYLKPNVVIEPLFDNWYAWAHLISPATASMNLVNRHIAIMESYLTAPELHQDAVANPKMKGGPFMDFGRQRVEEIRTLLSNTRKQQGRLLEFAEAIKVLDKLLLTEATGSGMEILYEKIPPVLKGFVELHYDRNNCPGFRFFESLLYKSEFYNKQSQSIALWITNNDQRPFCLSTPRLTEPDVLQLPISFDSHVIDEIAAMKRKGGSVDQLRSKLGITDQQQELFDSFFTHMPPPAYIPYTGDKIRMRYFGHACILIETGSVSILVDPVISYYGYDSDVDHFSDVDLPDMIDYILITHNHQDHVLFETLLPLRHKVKNIVVPRTYGGKLEDPDMKLMFESIGFKNIIAIEEMQSIGLGDVKITGLPFTGEHSDLDILTKLCYLVEVSGFKLMFLADSRIVEPALYRHILKETGKVDVLFLGMECDGAPLSWLYGPLMTKKITRDQDGSRRLAGSDCAKGLSLIDIFEPREMYVYAMGQEPWLEFISSIKYTEESNPIIQSDNLVKYCTDKGIISERLFGEKELLYNRASAPQRKLII